MKIATFYSFFDHKEPGSTREWVLAYGAEHDVRGIFLVAPQGINATVGAEEEALEAFLLSLQERLSLTLTNIKYSEAEFNPFKAMRSRNVKELIKFQKPGADPRNQVGTYVRAEEWNDLISRDDVLLLDTRNEYEMKAGTFRGAVDPEINSFTEFASYVDKNLDPKRDKHVAMFCTGGIRCEVATSYLLMQGFENVYHLEGGILKYLEEVPQEDSLWDGECFVFDHRVSLGHDLRPGKYLLCYGCGWPMSKSEIDDPRNEGCVRCDHCRESQTAEEYQSALERKKQNELAVARGLNNPRRVTL